MRGRRGARREQIYARARSRAAERHLCSHSYFLYLTPPSARSKLATFLPNKVFYRNADAKWDAAKSALIITFPLDKSDSLMGGQ